MACRPAFSVKDSQSRIGSVFGQAIVAAADDGQLFWRVHCNKGYAANV